ncbi:MAG: 50S ribosomal protein L25 [Chloroflexota bacterium]
MTNVLELEVAPRTAAGKANKALRRQGQVPVHVIGHGVNSMPLQADEKLLRRTLERAGGSSLVKLSGVGDARTVLVRAVQRHPVTGALIHVDFYQVRMDEKTVIQLPLAFVGEAPAVKTLGGTLMHAIEAVHLEALPGDLPRHIEVDLGVLVELEQAIHIKDLPIPVKARLLNDPEELVVKVMPPKVSETAPASAAAPPEPSTEG